MAGRSPSRADIKRSLEEQLRRQGGEVSHFQDLICDYMSFYEVKEKLEKDIEKRGVSYETMSASGYPVIKQNQSIKDLVAVNKQMLTLLEKLKMTTDKAAVTQDEEL